jgi:hypothetical protein
MVARWFTDEARKIWKNWPWQYPGICLGAGKEGTGVLAENRIEHLPNYRHTMASHRCGPGFETGSVMWDFVVDKVALG